ncbi:actin cytoskeleton-regulatory complex protein pan1 isoform X3 [Gadus morhua]|uniref:actin cytoskeleton-regulatory complex protein pan1 isoform X3 n=1 Tax=Gadus morhua TaxID=8049 RepID=UPI0011B734AD|nr:actin cytoskeleton-regulatory complex protein pan1-like isoform X3 [Gadus morhua]
MNLGDGLLLHLENGKPQIVLLHRGATSGINKLYRPGLPRRPKGPLTSSAPLASSSTRRSTVTSRNSSKTPANHTTVVKSRAVSVLSVPERYRPPPRVPSSNRTTKTPANGRTRQTEALANGDADMREGLARLTNQEPTASSTFLSPDEEEVLKPSADQTQPEQNNPLLLPLRAPPPALAPPQAGAPPPSLAAPVSPPRALAAPRGRGREGQSSSCGGRASFLRSMTALLDPAELEERERRRSKQQDQLRAIEAQLAEQREQREEEKRRGEEEKRREEEAEEQRKMKEQAEKNILHLPLKAPPKALTPPQSLAPPPSPATPGSPPRAPATPPGPGRGEEPSSCGERASFLRSMTALLDPAEMEERERRRSKQQDQLRAIEAQLAEQREQREGEKRREEETEEKRKEQVEQIPQQQEVLLSSEKPIRELPRSHGHVVLKQHSVSIRGPKGGQGAKGEEPTRNKKRGKGDLYQELARPERTDTPRGLPAVRPPGPSSHHPEQDYFPYVRTADIIHLEPLDRNGTATPHPTNTHSQKEILLSLAALRKGLLQKQKEMESSGRLLPPVTSQRS